VKLNIRRNAVLKDEVLQVMGHRADPPLRRIAIISVVENPYLDRYEAQLSPLVEASVELGQSMAQRAKHELNGDVVESYGKAGLVGLRGEQEHANALLTTVFANPFREAIGGGKAWISSVTKVCNPGDSVDIPTNNIHDINVRSHYDAVSLSVANMPMPDEIAVIFCLLTRGRVGARVGGMTHEEAKKLALSH
jgi:hypothetical protein